MVLILKLDEYIVDIAVVDWWLVNILENFFFNATHEKVCEEDTERRPHGYTIKLAVEVTTRADEGSFFSAAFKKIFQDVLRDVQWCGGTASVDLVEDVIYGAVDRDIRK